MEPKRGTLSFKTVGQDRRRPRGRGASEGSAVVKALLRGETLLIGDADSKPYSTGWTNRVLKAHKLRAVTRQDADGTVVWAVPVDLPSGEEHTYQPEAVETT